MSPDGALVPRGGQLGELAHRDVALAARDHDLGPVEGDGHLHLEIGAASRFTVEELGRIARRSCSGRKARNGAILEVAVEWTNDWISRK